MKELHRHGGHRQRLKNRFLACGECAFEDYELLELLLFYSVPQVDTNPLAHRLIDHFGSLSGVMDATVEDLVRVDGVGKHMALLIHLLPQFARRYQQDRVKLDTVVTCTDDASTLLAPYFYGARNEMLYLLSLDAKGRVLGCDLLHEGSATLCTLDIRLVTETALRHRARSVLLAHCHVSGLAVPSPEDRIATIQCKNVLDKLQIDLLDHLVFADGDYVSMARSGLLR